MKPARTWIRAYRSMAIAALLATALGTSCLGPSVYVLHRFDLPYSPDSSYAFPKTAPLDSADFSLVGRHRRGAPRSNPPICRGFSVYAADTIPRSWQYEASGGGALPPIQFDVRLSRGMSPHLLIAYDYTLPLSQRDSTAVSAAEAARTAAREAEYAQRAELLAHLILRDGPLPSSAAPTTTFRSRSLEEVRAQCEANQHPSS